MSILSSPIPLYQLPETKYCKGCNKWLSIELFGYHSKNKSKTSARCMECNRKAGKVKYYRNRNNILAKKRAERQAPSPLTRTYIPLKIHPTDGLKLKHCPYCKVRLHVCPECKEGTCYRCEETFTVHKVLSYKHGGIKLCKIKKDNSIDVLLKLIHKYDFLYIVELSMKAGLNRHLVDRTLNKMETQGLIIKYRRFNIGGNKTYIKITEAGIKMVQL